MSSKRVGSAAAPRQVAGVAPLPDDPAGAHLRIGAGFFDGWTPGDWQLLPWTPMKERLDWSTDGADWPNRAASRFVTAAGLRWHVQVAGAGPVLLLLHGTGASTHSWRDLIPLLAPRFTVVAADLPGHGFTDPLPASRVSLQGMAGAHGALLEALQLAPALAVGHSAGAAILLHMALDQRIAPAGIVSLNGALLPFRGWAGVLFAPMARMMTMTPLASTLFARRARDPAAVARLVASTGSSIDATGVTLYQRLLCARSHVAGALDMMANWDLAPLAARLPRLKTALVLVAGESDSTVNPAEARRVQALVPGARLVQLPGLGHLAHEEAPARIADLVVAQAESLGALRAQQPHHHAAMHAKRHTGQTAPTNADPSNQP